MVLTVHVGAIALDPVGLHPVPRRQRGTARLARRLGGRPAASHRRDPRRRDRLGRRPHAPVAPMLGFVGTSPGMHETWANVWAGLHGGNLDVQELTDRRGDHPAGERAGGPAPRRRHARPPGRRRDLRRRGASRRRASSRLRCELAAAPATSPGRGSRTRPTGWSPRRAGPPRTPSAPRWKALILWLEEADGMSRGDAYLWLGQVLEARCTQFVNPTFTYVCKIAKEYLTSG